MGNVLDNACKYCLEFVEISTNQGVTCCIFSSNDGRGIPHGKRSTDATSLQRADTYDPGQALGLAVARGLRNNTPGKSLPATVCSAVPV